MRAIIEKDYEEALSKWAADHVVETINRFQPTAERPFVLGLPTGSSPQGSLPNLVKAVKKGKVSFQACHHLQYRSICRFAPNLILELSLFMATNLFNHIDCPKENIHILNLVMPRTWKRSAVIMSR